MRKIGIAAVLLATTLAGCASTRNEPTAQAPDFSRLPNKVAVEEVRLASSVMPDLPAADRAALAARLRAAVISSLPTSAVVAESAPGVLRLEVTVTDLNAVNPTLNGFSQTLILVPMDRGGISFEARYYEGVGREPVAFTAQRATGSMFDIKGNFSHYGHAIEALEKWATELGQSLERS
jgi:uncharacterized protein DUF3313